MKQNKWGFFFSIICTVLSLTGYLCSKFICFNANSVLADICVAIFSSSVFVVILSSIGYLVEKNRQRNLILDSCFVNWLDVDVTFENGNLKLGIKELKSILNTLLSNLILLKNNLQEYYKGLILKDKILKDLINKKLYELYKTAYKFLTYLAYPACKNDMVKIRFEKLMEHHEEISATIIEWMKRKNFELGKEFDFGENFVAEYEKETLELNKN